MASRRILKAAEAIREVVSLAILTEIRDPRVQNVTVTGVEVAPDMRTAKILVSVMGDEGKQQLCLRGLANSAGFLQSKIAKRIDTRYTPRLTFELDLGVKRSLEVGRILLDLAKERESLDVDKNPDRQEESSVVAPEADNWDSSDAHQ
jgi:ribosome-binding factor A